MLSRLWEWFTSTSQEDKEYIVEIIHKKEKLKRSLAAVEALGDKHDDGRILSKAEMAKRQALISKAKAVLIDLQSDLNQYTAGQIENALKSYKAD